MNVIEIVKKYLIDNGYDGLHHACGCGCGLDDLVPCGDIEEKCEAAYANNCPTCGGYKQCWDEDPDITVMYNTKRCWVKENEE